MTRISPARLVSYRTLSKVLGGGYASDLLRLECANLDARDAALAESIVFGCLRHQSQLDFLITHFSGRQQLKLDDEVRLALRIGIFQIYFLDRIPKHAAVGESVELVKKAQKVSAAGFVNAVLRKAAKVPVSWPDPATELSIPAWMLKRWEARYGHVMVETIARAALEEPVSYVEPETGRRQDIGAQSIVPLLRIERGMRVLDVCAAPGNKTAQIIAAGGVVFATDRYLRRLVDVPPGANRVVVDAAVPLPFRESSFDRILVDAPCSGTGTLARNPEIKWRLRPDDLVRFQTLQKAILARALECLKPDGLLVYSTCSLEPEENENAVEGYRVQEMTHRLPGRDPGDGFFAAVITR